MMSLSVIQTLGVYFGTASQVIILLGCQKPYHWQGKMYCKMNILGIAAKTMQYKLAFAIHL